MKEERRRQKDLGIFYTDERIVNFIFDVLLLWKEKEDEKTHRWNSSSDKKKYPSVIDPACGEGGFLKGALNKNFTQPKYVWGVDIDEEVKKKWEDINLLKSFGSHAEIDNHFIHQNGLLPLPEKRFRYKKGGLEEFDCVVGNPPYGGIGIRPKKPDLETQNLLSNLQKYEIFSYKKYSNGGNNKKNILFKLKEEKSRFSLIDIAKLAQGMPIEVLFIERFIQLTKPGGYIAMIIPDGVLANVNLGYVRKFIAANTKVEGIVSLPREAFKNVGTSAKTSILFLKKPKDKKEIEDLNYPVLLANVTGKVERLKLVYDYYKEVYPMNSKPNVAKDKVVVANFPDGGRVTVWVTKTVKDFVEEKPSDRLDPKYWLPEYEELMKELLKSPYPLSSLGKLDDKGKEVGFIKLITYGSTKPRDYSPKVGKGIKYIRSVNVLFTGLNVADIHWIREGGRLDSEQYRVHYKDVIMNKCGAGTSGRSFCYLKHDKIVVSQHTMLIRLKGIEPCYFVVFMNTKYGAYQFERYDKGTSGQTHVDFPDVRSIKIPVLPQLVQSYIESEYKKVSVYHDKAMEAKSKGNEVAYKKNIEIAEKMLKDLIAKTEAVIRGERKDVV